MAQFPHLLVTCTRHRLTEVVTTVQSGWRQLEEFLYRNHAQNLPEKVYCTCLSASLRWWAQLVTEIMARVAVAPVPVVAFKKLQ